MKYLLVRRTSPRTTERHLDSVLYLSSKMYGHRTEYCAYNVRLSFTLSECSGVSESYSGNDMHAWEPNVSKVTHDGLCYDCRELTHKNAKMAAFWNAERVRVLM